MHVLTDVLYGDMKRVKAPPRKGHITCENPLK